MIHKNMVGKLDNRVVFLTEFQVDDGSGGKCSTFREFAQAWSFVFIASGTENFKFNRVFALDNYVFVIRNRSDVTITTSDVIEYDGERMNIVHVTKTDNRDLYIAIEATKGGGI